MWQNMLGWASHSLPYLPFPCVQNIKKMENYQKVLPPKDKVSVPLGLRASLPVLSLSLSLTPCVSLLFGLCSFYFHTLPLGSSHSLLSRSFSHLASMAINRESSPPPMIGKIGPYTVFMTPPSTPKPSQQPVSDSPKKIVSPPPVQPPPQQFSKSTDTVSSDGSFLGFFKNAVTKVQNGMWVFLGFEGSLLWFFFILFLFYFLLFSHNRKKQKKKKMKFCFGSGRNEKEKEKPW